MQSRRRVVRGRTTREVSFLHQESNTQVTIPADTFVVQGDDNRWRVWNRSDAEKAGLQSWHSYIHWLYVPEDAVRVDGEVK